MKIGVIGATGREGKLILDEAIRRGHDVTAIVRDAKKLADPSVKVIEKSIFELSRDDLKNFDVVISAFGVAPGMGLEYQYVTTTMSLCNIMSTIQGARLIISGGAASLYEDETMSRRLVDHIEDIPEAFRGVPYNAYLGFEELKKSNAVWTYFSPAIVFDPDGPATGNYTRGGDVIIKNDAGESYLSYADAAVAILDEAEQGGAICKRFTAVSNTGRKTETAAFPEDKPADAPETVQEVKAEETPAEEAAPAEAETVSAPETVPEAENTEIPVPEPEQAPAKEAEVITEQKEDSLEEAVRLAMAAAQETEKAKASEDSEIKEVVIPDAEEFVTAEPVNEAAAEEAAQISLENIDITFEPVKEEAEPVVRTVPEPEAAPVPEIEPEIRPEAEPAAPEKTEMLIANAAGGTDGQTSLVEQEILKKGGKRVGFFKFLRLLFKRKKMVLFYIEGE